RTTEMHSLLSGLSPDQRDAVGAALARALDEIQATIAPAARTATPACPVRAEITRGRSSTRSACHPDDRLATTLNSLKGRRTAVSPQAPKVATLQPPKAANVRTCSYGLI